MAKPKINVLSNKLDQAPKTKAAGYNKVVDSMKKEMTEAMNGVNKPKILSNELDQAPKTRIAGYEENVLKPLEKEIDERMDMLFMEGNDSICDYVNHFVSEAENVFIKNCILRLNAGDSLSFEIKREKIKPSGELFQSAVGHPAFLGSFDNFLHNFYGRAESGSLKPGEISSAIVIKKDEKDPHILHVHAEQLEYPGKGSFLMDGIFFHNPDVNNKQFQEIIKSNKSNDTKEPEEKAEEKNEQESKKDNDKNPARKDVEKKDTMKDEVKKHVQKKEVKKEKSLTDKIKGRFGN